MKPIGLLMKEHKKIEKVIDVLKLELQNQQRTTTPNTGIIMTSVDFFQTYADTTHHGKEENILFKKMQEKSLSDEHKTLLKGLLKDHQQARSLVTRLYQLNETYRTGDRNVVQEISNTIQKLTLLYTNHIDKEDNQFFSVINDYLTEEEQAKMLDEFYDFDKGMIHQKYEDVVEQLHSM